MRVRCAAVKIRGEGWGGGDRRLLSDAIRLINNRRRSLAIVSMRRSASSMTGGGGCASDVAAMWFQLALTLPGFQHYVSVHPFK